MKTKIIGASLALIIFIGIVDQFLEADVKLGSEMQRTVPTLADYIKGSDYVIVASGETLHWVKAGERIELGHPSFADGSHDGPIVLTAKVISVLRCPKTCPQSDTVQITLVGSTGIDDRGRVITDGHNLLGQQMIFLAYEGNATLTRDYPKQLIGPWNVASLTARTAYPLSARSDVEQAIKSVESKK